MFCVHSHISLTSLVSQNRTDDLLTISIVTVPQDDVLNVKTPIKIGNGSAAPYWDIYIDALACRYTIHISVCVAEWVRSRAFSLHCTTS